MTAAHASWIINSQLAKGSRSVTADMLLGKHQPLDSDEIRAHFKERIDKQNEKDSWQHF